MDETRIKVDVGATKKTMGIIVWMFGALALLGGCGIGYVIFRLLGWW